MRKPLIIRHATSAKNNFDALRTGLVAAGWSVPSTTPRILRAACIGFKRGDRVRGQEPSPVIYPGLQEKRGDMMRTKNRVYWIFILVAAVSAAAVTMAQTTAKSDAVAAVTKLENGAVKADLANDKAFYEGLLADDWTGADSEGTWFTKAELLKMMDDPKNNSTKSEKISDLKVRVYGATAVATYKDTYDAMINGEHRATTVLGTDTFAKIAGQWKEVASHSCKAK
jgi:Domain of unknown function (DUF4440)